jgi:chemotaxis protein MotD
MKGGPELRPTSALAGAALPGRSTEGGNAKQATRSSSPFEALFARMHSEPAPNGPEGGKDGTARIKGEPIAVEGRRTRLGATSEGKADREVDGAVETRVAADAVRLDGLVPGQSLASAVAHRIAAAVDGAPATAASAEVAPEMRAEAGESRRGGPIAANLALAIAAARRVEIAGQVGAAAAADPAVTHRETHFAPVLEGDGTTSSAEPSAKPERGDAAAARTAPGPFALLRGRAEQLMMAGRAAPGDARMPRGEAGDAPTGAAVRATAGAANPGGADVAGADRLESTLLQGAATGGAAPGRAVAPAPAAGSPVTQPAAVPVFAGAAGPVKVLHIQLQPVELGALEIQMRLTDAGLEVHIEATRQETLTLLRNDREALAQVLRGAGHSVDTVTISLADKSAPQGQAAQDGSQPQSFGARADTQSGTPREQGDRQEDGFTSRPQGGQAFEKVNDDQAQPALAARRHGDLYL